jgi:hypothetical protein
MTSLVSSPLTTPEEAQAFLASMRDKQKAAEAVGKQPAHLTGDGMNAWHHQQREREKELRRRRQEAEQLLRGYRMTMSHDKATASTTKRDSYGFSPGRGQLFEKDMGVITESVDNIDFEVGPGNVREVGRLSIEQRPYHLTGQSRNEQEVGRLGIDERAWKLSDRFAPNGRDVGRLNVNASGSYESDPFATGSSKTDGSGSILETLSNEGKKSEDGKEKGMSLSSMGHKKVPTPGRALIPDETEWRDFVSSGEYQMIKSICVRLVVRVVTDRFSIRANRTWSAIPTGKWEVSFVCKLRLPRLSPGIDYSSVERIRRCRFGNYSSSYLEIDERKQSRRERSTRLGLWRSRRGALFQHGRSWRPISASLSRQ